jgi:pilus assembly protein CpaB
VKQGELITAEKITAITVGAYNLPDSVIKDSGEAVGKYAVCDMLAGDYILSAKLTDEPIAEFSYLHELNGTHEAISITIKSFAAGLSGKLEAGDIISLIAVNAGELGETFIPRELRYVKVLAVTDGKGYDKEYTNINSSVNSEVDEKVLPSTVTLLVEPAQALRLAELEANATLHSTLVYRGDVKKCDEFLKIQAVDLTELAALKAAEEGAGLTAEETGASGINAMGIDASEIDALGINTIGIDTPGINAMGIDELGINEMGIDASGINTPYINTQNINAPVVNVPDINIPEVPPDGQ